MADGDPLYPGDTSLLQQWQYPGQWWGLPNPYEGLNQNDPLFQYGNQFNPLMPSGWDAWADQTLFGPEGGPYAQFAGIQPNFDPNLQGTVEQPPSASPSDILQSQLQAQSTGFAPAGGALSGELPTNAPWIGAVQPGALQSEAGFGDISLGGF